MVQLNILNVIHVNVRITGSTKENVNIKTFWQQKSQGLCNRKNNEQKVFFLETMLKHSNKRGTSNRLSEPFSKAIPSVCNANKRTGRPGTNYSKTGILG